MITIKDGIALGKHPANVRNHIFFYFGISRDKGVMIHKKDFVGGNNFKLFFLSCISGYAFRNHSGYFNYLTMFHGAAYGKISKGLQSL